MKTNVVTKDRAGMKPEAARADTCVHYWVIDPPDGPVSEGICKICGAEKEFKNYMFYSSWDSRIASLSGLGLEFESKDGDEENLM